MVVWFHDDWMVISRRAETAPTASAACPAIQTSFGFLIAAQFSQTN